MKAKNRNLDCEKEWVTSMGICKPGEKVILKDKNLFEDFADSSWLQVLLYGITGNLFNSNQAKLLDGIWKISTSYPEPRVWNNRVSSLAGTARSTPCLGLSAGIGVSEAEVYGLGPMLWVMDFLLRAMSEKKTGKPIEKIVDEEISRNKIIYGFGRPVDGQDERIKPLTSLAANLGYGDGEYLNLLSEIENELCIKKSKLNMNIAALCAALCADQGFSANEFYYFMSLCFSAGILFCGKDAFEHYEGAFFPLRCSTVHYAGSGEREW